MIEIGTYHHISINFSGTGFLSGHADGSIVRWYIADDQNARPQGNIKFSFPNF